MQSCLRGCLPRFAAVPPWFFTRYIIVYDLFFITRPLKKWVVFLVFPQRIADGYASGQVGFGLFMQHPNIDTNGFLRLYGIYEVVIFPAPIRVDFHQWWPWHRLNHSRPGDRSVSLMSKSPKRNLANHFWHSRSVKTLFSYTRHIFLWASAARLSFLK